MLVNAISLWEPWATAMRLKLKKNETRSWALPGGYIGKPLMICAAKTKSGMDTYAVEIVEQAPGFKEFNFGCAVALVLPVGCVKTEFIVESGGSCPTEMDLGDYTPGRWAWCTESINTIFEPFPVKGRQGLFQVEIDPKLLQPKERPF